VLGLGRETRELVTKKCQRVLEGGEKVVEQDGEVRRELTLNGAPEVQGREGGHGQKLLGGVGRRRKGGHGCGPCPQRGGEGEG
jgi:hypothetical protein